jgi:hypothetical protein
MFIQDKQQQQSNQHKHRLDRQILQVTLLDPHASPFERLFVSKSDNALIKFCGFDHQVFLL